VQNTKIERTVTLQCDLYSSRITIPANDLQDNQQRQLKAFEEYDDTACKAYLA
jgi:hypothetical protein